jgi:lipopolysaccharide export LptBFGC system permease protein LptF
MIGLRRHDRYVLAAFWSSFGAVVLFFTVVVVVLDVSERLARLLRHWDALGEAGYQPAWLLLEFYGTLLPFLWLKVVPICVPIATSFALARLSRRGELAPLVASGVPERRVVLPFIVSGVAIAALLIGVREVSAPTLGRRQLEVGRLLMRGTADRVTKVPHIFDPGGARLSMDAYLPLTRRMEGASLTIREADGRPTELLWYPTLDWQARGRRWVAERGGVAFPLGEGRTGSRRELAPGEAAPLRVSASVVEVTVTERGALGITIAESAALARAQPDNPKVVAMHHEQFTMPLSAVVLLLLALPFVFRLDTKSPLPGLLAVLGMGALYHASGLLVKSLGVSGTLNPVFVAWVPTVLFLSLGAALVLGMDR